MKKLLGIILLGGPLLYVGVQSFVSETGKLTAGGVYRGVTDLIPPKSGGVPPVIKIIEMPAIQMQHGQIVIPNEWQPIITQTTSSATIQYRPRFN